MTSTTSKLDLYDGARLRFPNCAYEGPKQHQGDELWLA